jgi:serine/threonine protein kinase
MALVSGARLGPYEIVAPLGAGGMGEVYRAPAGKLNRDVALKTTAEGSSPGPLHLTPWTPGSSEETNRGPTPGHESWSVSDGRRSGQWHPTIRRKRSAFR